jgi:hypothetical protein
MEEAKETLAKIRRLPQDHHFVQAELEEMSRGVNQEQEIKSATSWAGLFAELKRDATLRRRFILVLIVQIGESMVTKYFPCYNRRSSPDIPFIFQGSTFPAETRSPTIRPRF